MGIGIASSFTRNSNLPIDDSFSKADNTARDAIASGVRFEGLMVYVTSTQKLWQLKGGITNSDWKEVGTSADGRSGEVALSSGVNTASVTFSTAMASASFSVDGTIFNSTDADPAWLTFVVTARSTSGFSVKFNAPTDTANYIFLWKVSSYV